LLDNFKEILSDSFSVNVGTLVVLHHRHWSQQCFADQCNTLLGITSLEVLVIDY